MIKRWSFACSQCEDTDLFYEDDDGEAVFIDDLRPLIEKIRLGSEPFETPRMAHEHDAAVEELRSLLGDKIQ